MPQGLLACFLVFLGGGIGSVLRYLVSRSVALLADNPDFPYATLAINITGSLLIGLMSGWFAFRGDASQSLRLFLTTGICGGFTTFSAFSLETALLMERGQHASAALYVASSVLVSLGCVFAGMYLMRP